MQLPPSFLVFLSAIKKEHEAGLVFGRAEKMRLLHAGRPARASGGGGGRRRAGHRAFTMTGARARPPAPPGGERARDLQAWHYIFAGVKDSGVEIKLISAGAVICGLAKTTTCYS